MTDVFIYALIDPRDETIFYIGQTTTGAGEPENYIKRAGTAPTTRKVYRHLRQLHNLNVKASWEVLEETSETNIDDCETFWIGSLRAAGALLANVLDGGQHGFRGQKHRPETLEKMKMTWAKPETKKKISDAGKKAWSDPEKRKRWIDSRSTPEAKENHRAAIKAAFNTPEGRATKSRAAKEWRARKKGQNV